MTAKIFLIAAGSLGALAVILGAFSAHALNPLLVANGQKDVFVTANQYHFMHALALLGVGILMRVDGSLDRTLGYAGVCFLLGIAFFSGSLYLLALTNFKLLGAVAPLGGFFMVVGWVMLVVYALR